MLLTVKRKTTLVKTYRQIAVAMLLTLFQYVFSPLALAFNGMQLADYMKLKGSREPDAVLHYGKESSQYAQLFLAHAEKKTALSPVVILIHGGCWDKSAQGIPQMGELAEAFSQHGIAVWNVEYHRINEEGGGYPKTYNDISSAIDMLKQSAQQYSLDLSRVVLVGHSVGGHLVQWAAASNNMKSEYLQPANLAFKGVVALGSLPNMENMQQACSNLTETDYQNLLGMVNHQRKDPYSDTSPYHMGSPKTPVTLLNGARDTISIPDYANEYTEKYNQHPSEVKTIIVPGATHYDLVSTRSSAWPILLNEVRVLLGKQAEAQ
ncbi:alpha/beta hydrolase family protein [Serratia aquatilis]|uniref:Alpha/beta hydrolase family protein n=1 Tax=Serratia aquatilis TaxID=1737515 RepID=A0ABV6EDU4_9GAMM